MKHNHELILGRTWKGGAKSTRVDHGRIDWKDSRFPEESRLQWFHSSFIAH
jgi:hypothetical protein